MLRHIERWNLTTFHDHKFTDLARQLTYSPPEKRAVQLAAAIDLFTQILPTELYPWEFVLFRLTGYRPKDPIDHTIPGKFLRADLSRFIEFISDTLRQRSDQAPEPVLALEDITTQFKVSTKTVQRWRRQGLIAQRYIYPTGRHRLGFLKSAVERFAQANSARIQNAALFRRITAKERTKILFWARHLAARNQLTMKNITFRLARHFRRSEETIRYTLRQFDQAHPEQAIFPNFNGPIRSGDRQIILDYFNQGWSVQKIAKRYAKARSSIYRVVSYQRAELLKSQPVNYIPNPLFELPEADQIILHQLPAEAQAAAAAHEAASPKKKDPDKSTTTPETDAPIPKDWPAHFTEIFRQPVIPPEIELDLFRRMNYLKYKAAHLQQTLKSKQATSTQLAEIESCLSKAQSIKNQIIQANLRVAVFVARKHLRPANGTGPGSSAGAALTEMVSDAGIWLMRAVDLFDFSRNAKFSTYVSWAIAKNFARSRVEQISRRDRRMVTGQSERLDQLGARNQTSESTVSDQVSNLQLTDKLASLIQKLPPRERTLLTAHFGLDPAQPAQSLSQLGEKLGITKVRVRQLETRALRKLRRLLEENPTPDNAPNKSP